MSGLGEARKTADWRKTLLAKQAKPYFGGIPTEPDVRRLMDRFCAPEPGVIPHEEIEKEIREESDSSRYRTIVSAWRRRLRREHNIDTSAEPGHGIRILTEPERVDVSKRDLGRGVRGIVRSHVRIRM